MELGRNSVVKAQMERFCYKRLNKARLGLRCKKFIWARLGLSCNTSDEACLDSCKVLYRIYLGPNYKVTAKMQMRVNWNWVVKVKMELG